MIIILRRKAQVTIPHHIVRTMGLEIGDALDCDLHYGEIRLLPIKSFVKEKKFTTYSDVGFSDTKNQERMAAPPFQDRSVPVVLKKYPSK